MKISIDVIIPSFRVDEKYIIPILQLTKPAGAIVKFYIVADNPRVRIPGSIESLIDNENAFMLINEENKGAAETRNVGISASTGDWILFLDDDILVDQNLLAIYATAIAQFPGETGFIGLINFPPPASSFTKAIRASGSMDIFSIALRKKSFAWGATANTMVNRSALGDIRFSLVYPKSGGGEDMDFFLKMRRRNGYKDLKTLPEAVVQHPWWKNGKADFKRPFRYGKGNSHLGDENPDHTYYDFLNTPETLLIALTCLVILFFLKSALLIPALFFIAGVLVIEVIASAVQTIKRSHRVNIKVILFVTALRFVYECGVLLGKLSAGQFWRIGERFHDNGSIKRIFFYRFNTYKIVKWILYPLLIFYILLQHYE